MAWVPVGRADSYNSLGYDLVIGGYEMVNLCKNRVRLGSKKIRVRLVAGTTLRGYDLTSIPQIATTLCPVLITNSKCQNSFQYDISLHFVIKLIETFEV